MSVFIPTEKLKIPSISRRLCSILLAFCLIAPFGGMVHAGTGQFVDLDSYLWDFGAETTAVEPGWSRLAPSDKDGFVKWTHDFDMEVQWVETQQMNDNMKRDYVIGRGNRPMSLAHQLNNGTWDVTVHFAGNTIENIHVDAEGRRRISYLRNEHGNVRSETFRVEVEDGVLDLVFEDANSEHVICVAGMEVKLVDYAVSTGAFLDKKQYKWDIGGSAADQATLDPHGPSLEPGWERLTPETRNGYVKWTHDFNAGAEWRSTAEMNDNMKRDFIVGQGNKPMTLEHELSNGTWDVTVHFAGFTMNNIHLFAEGQRPVSYLSKAYGEVRSETVRVVVEDGVLDLVFEDTNSEHLICVAGIEVTLVDYGVTTGEFVDKRHYKWDMSGAGAEDAELDGYGSSLEPGWQRLTPKTKDGYVKWTHAFTAEQRWLSSEQMNDNMKRDYIVGRGNKPMTLSHVIKNGIWDVTLYFSGNTIENIHVDLEGKRVISYLSNPFKNVRKETFRVEVTDGVLNLLLEDTNSEHTICVAGLEIKRADHYGLRAEITMDGVRDEANSGTITCEHWQDESWQMYPTRIEGAGLYNHVQTDIDPYYRIVKTTGDARRGEHALMFNLPRLAPISLIPEEQHDAYNALFKDRLEMRVLAYDDFDKYVLKTTYLGFSLKIPSGNQPPDGWHVILQLHQSAPESPPFSLSLTAENEILASCTSGPNKQRSSQVSLPRVDLPGEERFTLPFDQWIDFVVKFRFDPHGEDGHVTVYTFDPSSELPPKMIYQYDGALGFSDVDVSHMTLAMGHYRRLNRSTSQTLFYDEVRVGDSINSVLPWKSDSDWRFLVRDDAEELKRVPDTFSLFSNHQRLQDQPRLTTPAPNGTLSEVISFMEWESVPGASSYEVYLWKKGEEQPLVPTGYAFKNKWHPWSSSFSFEPAVPYQWQVVAKNEINTTASPTQGFTYAAAPLRDFKEGTLYRWDLGDDNTAVAKGWNRLTPDQKSGPVRWTHDFNMEVRSNISSEMNNRMNRDYIVATGQDPVTLAHDVSNGIWDITFHFSGNTINNIHVIAEGERQISYLDNPYQSVRVETIRVLVTDGVLDVVVDDANTDNLICLAGIEIKRVRTGYDVWAEQNGALLDSSQDTNENGMPDLLDYFMGGSSTENGTLKPLIVNDGERNSLKIPYNSTAQDVEWFVEASDSLTENIWERLEPDFTINIIDEANSHIEIFPGPSEFASRQFYRLGALPRHAGLIE